MTGIRADLRSLPWWAAAGLALLAVVVLALRVVGLAVCVLVDTVERVEIALSAAAGIAPLGGSSWPLTDSSIPGWTVKGGAR
ncbi:MULTISPECIES: hypothetical protein [Protofrankia]|uniref:Uncharacterized protein n=1 Tax=Candidatus Protofrankia datiscae TaxID=2716812 RepID=F8AZ98_9ACTN|nr:MULTISPECIES: hypothetical protein [Protofrankia]AEH11627.1 hypothetical protein FsymDg_4374 [Candidatus Protofrankia datiscae]